MHFKGISSPDADQSRVGEFGGWGMGLESLSSWAYAVGHFSLLCLSVTSTQAHTDTESHRQIDTRHKQAHKHPHTHLSSYTRGSV